ncbi:alpha/beta hydrolase [Marinomonas transparens]|uniref:Alpha/beta hydrolase n=1 Tax=Marinomonas transparens TaxID=2795388 RepID=A0A934JUU5_9GAMM|nr:alpha/beta hydrolase [Marinomonas transparens]MBJ7537462.1 alpha/beta hydrolase [Marinomonas transparens]
MTTLTAGKNRVEFLSSGSRIAGDLYCPDNFDSNKAYPAIVSAGPLAAVKEQAAGFYAEKLSKKGFLVLAFDYRTFGESEGQPRCYENPAYKTDDIHNAVSYLSSLNNIDSNKIAALGICASASYIGGALIGDKRIKAFASVSGYFNLHDVIAFNPLVSDEIREAMFEQSNNARQKYFETGEAIRSDLLYSAFDGKSEEQFMKDVYDYFFTRVESCWPNFSRDLTLFSVEELAKSNVLNFAPFITTPYLGVVGENAPTRYQTEQFIEAKSQGMSQIKVINGACHIQAYDLDNYVDQAVDSINDFLNEQLKG